MPLPLKLLLGLKRVYRSPNNANCRQRRAAAAEALAGGGSGSIGGHKGDDWGRGDGGGRDGGGGDGPGDSSSPDQPKKGGFYWQGWTDRVAADPEFPFKVLLEQV